MYACTCFDSARWRCIQTPAQAMRVVCVGVWRNYSTVTSRTLRTCVDICDRFVERHTAPAGKARGMANRVRSRVLSIIGADSGAAPGKLSSTGQGRREARDSARSARAKDLERKAFRSELDKMMANKRAFDRADGDGSGLIDFHEFCGMDVNKGARWSELRMLFDRSVSLSLSLSVSVCLSVCLCLCLCLCLSVSFSLCLCLCLSLSLFVYICMHACMHTCAFMHSCTRNSLDEDGNGVLDQEEFARYQEVLEEQALEHKAIFDRIDKNKSGKLTHARRKRERGRERRGRERDEGSDRIAEARSITE